jgi:hypothetical protein
MYGVKIAMLIIWIFKLVHQLTPNGFPFLVMVIPVQLLLRPSMMLTEKLVSDVKANPALRYIYSCMFVQWRWLKYTTRLYWGERSTHIGGPHGCTIPQILSVCMRTCTHLQLYGWWEKAAEEWAETLFASALHPAGLWSVVVCISSYCHAGTRQGHAVPPHLAAKSFISSIFWDIGMYLVEQWMEWKITRVQCHGLMSLVQWIMSSMH